MKKIKRILGDMNAFQIVVLGDMHIGDNLCDIDLVKYTIDYIKRTKNCYAILNGDLMNNALKSSKSDTYLETSSIEEQQNTLIELLKPIKDKILVIASGNHEYRTNILAGINPLKAVAYALGLPNLYVDSGYMLRLEFGSISGTKVRNKYMIFGIHGGSGGGRRHGSTANALEDMAKIRPNMNLYVHSHTHAQMNFTDMVFMYDTMHDKDIEFQRTFYNANAFLKYGGYAEQKGFIPTDRSPNAITIAAVRKPDGMKIVTNIVKI